MNTNFDLIKSFQKHDILANIKEFDFGSLVTLKNSISVYENYVLVNRLLNKKDIEKIEVEFKKINKTATIYFENRADLKKNVEFLKENNYLHEWKDSWLFYEKKVLEDDMFKKAKRVENENDLDVFLEIFNNSYQKNDPQNPYGEITEYLINSKNRWIEFHGSNYLQYFIAYKNSEPVAVAALTSANGLGYISAVGSLKKVRGEGFGKLITLYSVFISQKIGNNKHFLLTEDGTYPCEFYKRIGFNPEFSAIGMFK